MSTRALRYEHMFDTSLLDHLRDDDVTAVPDGLLEERFSSLQQLIDRLEVERLRRLAEIDRRGLHQRDGHLSAVSWLPARTASRDRPPPQMFARRARSSRCHSLVTRSSGAS